MAIFERCLKKDGESANSSPEASTRRSTGRGSLIIRHSWRHRFGPSEPRKVKWHVNGDALTIRSEAVPLHEHAAVRLAGHSFENAPQFTDLEKSDWYRQSELTLLKAWENDQDDVYNALLTK